MNYLELGTTGMTISEVSFGGIPIIRLETDEAVRVLRRAFDHGINFYDTANAYHDSQNKMGRAFKGLRDRIFIATKALSRDAKGAARQIDASLEALGTDYIDLFQLHQVAQEKDFNAITAPGGAMDAVVKAQEAGKIRHIGISSHNLRMAIRLVRSGLFKTIQFPFNFIETEAVEELHPAARDLGVGILAMKPFAGGVIDNGRLAFTFLRQYPVAIPLTGFDSVRSVDEVVGFYSAPNVVTEKDRVLMDDYRRDLGREFCRRCEYCQPCSKGVVITTAMSYHVIASRMAPRVASNFAQKAMESVALCEECNECLERCPYNLPIPVIIRRNEELYRKHRRENPPTHDS